LELKGPFDRDRLKLENDPSRRYFVQGSYRFTTPTEQVNALWMAREFIDGLLDVLITGANLGYYSSFLKLVDLGLSCENSQDIVQAGQKIPNYPRMGTYEEFQPISIDEPSLVGYLDGARKIRLKVGGKYHQIATLLRAGVTASDEYAKFFGIWRSFNAFYNHLIPGDDKDAAKVEKFAKKALQLHEANGIVDFYNKASIASWGEMQLRLVLLGHKNIFEMLTKARLKSWRGGRNYSSELVKALLSGDPFSILTSSLLCLYSVRNGVIHGSRYSHLEADFLYLCSLLLQEIVMNALQIQFIRRYAV